MAEQVIMFIDKGDNPHFNNFIEFFSHNSQITMGDLRSKIPLSTLYKIILKKVYHINQTLMQLNPALDFISPSLESSKGRIVQVFKRNDGIEIISNDENFIQIKVKQKN